MTLSFRRIIAIIGLAALPVLSGCSETIYPSLSNLTGIGEGTLTADEQKQAINDLSAEQESHGTEAAEEIERR